ncbi:MAG: molybdate ABC transporter substrate-binding protein [Desulfomonilaceae bacterium]
MKRFLMIAVVLFLSQSLAFAESLILAAGAGYKRPLTAIIQAYEMAGGGKIDQIYGNVGNIVMEVKASGKVAFMVADANFLNSSGLQFASFHELGSGVLVIAYRKNVKIQQPDDLLKPEITKVAIPDKKFAIYGKAGNEYLRNAGLLDKMRKKLLVVATVPQVSSYLISGNVDAGFINLTDALYIKDKLGGYVTVDRASYNPIKIVVGVVKGYQNNPETKKFLHFLKSAPEVKGILKKAGL